MKTFISSLILLIIILQNSYPQEPNIDKYWPLNTGNIWVYNWIYMGNPVTGGTTRSVVTNDTLINAKKYYKCSFPVLGLQFLRLDSLSENVYLYNPTGGCSYHFGEILIDSLRSGLNDTVSFCDTIYRLCVDTGSVILFGNQHPKKDFDPFNELTASSRFYAKNLGLYFLNMGDYYTTRFTLKGCVINGIVYGDTAVPTGIQQINTLIPDNYSLSQNYPNPFNPVTKIKFDIPSNVKSEKSNVKLIIYDILGREVATLVNEQLKPGTYEVEWNGMNYPSGVYFYQLSINNEQLETRKMVLVK
jgi:hypothetical protein